jgi:hypothetical protein
VKQFGFFMYGGHIPIKFKLRKDSISCRIGFHDILYVNISKTAPKYDIEVVTFAIL